jgi:NitT/TauT family transport system permease protein
MPVIPALAGIGLWQLWITQLPGHTFFLGSPLGTWKELLAAMSSGDLPYHMGITALEAVLGFLAGSVIGTAFGLLLWLSPSAYRISRPYLIALGSLPVFALGPVLIFWFGTGIASKAALGFLATFVIALSQAYTGAKEADVNLLRLTLAFGGNRWQMLQKIVAPSSAIWVLTGLRLNLGMALLGAFVGEFLSSRAGLGYFIITAEGLYNVNQIWVGTLGITTLALGFHLLTLPIEKWARRWQ